VSRVWVYQVRDRAQKLGKRTSFQIGGHRRSRVAEMESVLRAWIEAEPDLTLSELCARLAKQDVFIGCTGTLFPCFKRVQNWFRKPRHINHWTCPILLFQKVRVLQHCYIDTEFVLAHSLMLSKSNFLVDGVSCEPFFGQIPC
jgi:hypothetical protein